MLNTNVDERMLTSKMVQSMLVDPSKQFLLILKAKGQLFLVYLYFPHMSSFWKFFF